MLEIDEVAADSPGRERAPETLPAEPVVTLAHVVDLVRRHRAASRPELVRVSGLGRTVVAQRVDQAVELGLLEDYTLGASTGGRAPRRLRFVSEHGHYLVAVFGVLNVGVAVTDLVGTITAEWHGRWDLASGPEASLERVGEIYQELTGGEPANRLWGIAIGLPGPVEFATGRPVAPPMMPGWDGFDIPKFLRERHHAPVFVDNDANLLALGEWSRLPHGSQSDLLFVKVGAGIGAGFVSHGHVYRGASGAAGDVGHFRVTDDPSVICRCGQRGCLEAVASGWALARDGEVAAREGGSPFLAHRLAENGTITPADLADGARAGDPYSVAAVAESGRIVGQTLAALVSFANPSMVVVAGVIADTGDLFLAAVRENVYGRSLPLATRTLQIAPSSLGHQLSLLGGARLIEDQLFRTPALYSWIAQGEPAG